MAKTIQIPAQISGDHGDKHYRVNEGEVLTIEFPLAGLFATSGDTTAFDPALESCEINQGDPPKSYTAGQYPADVGYYFLVSGSTRKENGDIQIE